MTLTGRVGVTVRLTRPSRSRERRVWVSIFWLTPASRRDSSEERRGPSLPSAAIINATHLSETRSSSWRLGQFARNASYSAFACARFWVAVLVGIDRSFPTRRWPTHSKVRTSHQRATY